MPILFGLGLRATGLKTTSRPIPYLYGTAAISLILPICKTVIHSRTSGFVANCSPSGMLESTLEPCITQNPSAPKVSESQPKPVLKIIAAANTRRILSSLDSSKFCINCPAITILSPAQPKRVNVKSSPTPHSFTKVFLDSFNASTTSTRREKSSK